MPALDCRLPKAAWASAVGALNGDSASRPEYSAKEPDADAGPWEPAVEKIVELRHLSDDWDGFGAKAPSRELLESAIGLAYTFYQNGVDAPHRVVAGVDGSVIFEWQDPDGTYTEVENVRPFYAEAMMIEPGKPPQHWTLPSE